jgi:hypothetical protein
MGESSLGGGWLFVIVILVVLFGLGGGGFGGNAAAVGYATMADVNAAINNQSTQQALGAISLSSANNNYETARLISEQNMNMMQQNNTNLINAIQGFNTTNQSIASGFASVNQNIANLGYKMEECCCGIKTMLLENRLQDTQIALQNSNTVNAINAQSQYLLSQLGTYTPAAPAAYTSK